MNGKVEFGTKQSTIRRHSRSQYPAITYNIESLASMLQTGAWKNRMKFKNIVDGEIAGKKYYLENGFKVWGVTDSEGYSAVVLAPETILPQISRGTYAFMDATFQSIPFIKRAYQLLVCLIEVNGKVSKRYVLLKTKRFL